MSNRPPFAKGDPRAKVYGSLGGRSARVPKVQQVLAALAPLTIGDWMTRFDMTTPSWETWRIVGKILDGLPLTAAERETYRTISGGRTTVPDKSKLRVLWQLFGRGSGKSTFDAVPAVQAAVQQYTLKIPATILFCAFVRDQASIAFDLVRDWFAKDDDLKQLVQSSTRDRLVLHHNVVLRTIQSSWRSVRGYACPLVLADESSVWWTEAEARNPDTEVFRALLPALGKVAGSRLLCPTTPFGRQGQAFEAYQTHYGADDSDVLVLQAPTLVMNPSFDRSVIAAMERDDPENAASEFDVQWRGDREGFVRLEVLEAATAHGVSERAPVWGEAA
jgi:hypothetical protein